ncbi:MAG: SEC-C metal-binding domain-containing protein [Pyrinomonadaceae bacterium]|nr:SEC-C metal-binding domain-containing protein [Pyrinomonadaceae bacterium]
MTKTSRNDPCPCGSGKKYKKCCLRSVEADEFEYRRQRQVEAGLIPRLLDHAYETLGPNSLADAWEEFNDYEPVEDFDPESPMNIVFMPWYIFNWIHEFKAKGKRVVETTIAESFLKKYKKSLTADEAACDDESDRSATLGFVV